jgi:hypothetical protein
VRLISRHAEAAGIPTLCMSSALDVTKSVNPPRAAFLDYPLGHTTGKPKDPILQREILIDALDAFSSLTEPGSVKVLPFEFSEDTSWKIAVETSGDERLPRYDTPQFQTDEDRTRAAAGDRSAIASCGCSFCFENWKNRGDLR